MAYGKKGKHKMPGLNLKSDMKMEGASKKGFKVGGKKSANKKLHKKEEPK
jgi:hypothetical protein